MNLLPQPPVRSLPLRLTALMLAMLPATWAAAQQAPAEKTTEPEVVLKPTPFTEQELRVVRNLSTLSTERLGELLKVYEKLENDAMLQILVRQILRRNPKHPEALRISQTVGPEEEVRAVGYLEKLASSVLEGVKTNDPDGVAAQAGSLLSEERAHEAVDLLEKLRDVSFQDKPFPYLSDLASAYQDAGQYEKAEAAFQSVLDSPGSSPENKQEAAQALPLIAKQKRIATLREAAIQDPDAGVELSAKLLEEMPTEPLALAFRVECLDRAGRYKEGVGFLLDLKDKSQSPAFEHQETLAYAYYGAKDYANAREAFLEIINNPTYDQEMRVGAEKMLVMLKVDERLDRSMTALNQGDLTAARVFLAELEREYPNDPDVFGLRCLIMAKSGQSKEALEELLRRRVEAARRGMLFREMDTLAEVYMERKEYILAISAYEDILQNPAYDSETRAAATRGMEDARRQQKLYKAYLAIADGDPAAVKAFNDDLQASSPQDPYVRLLDADIDLAYGRAREALAKYDEVRSHHFRTGPFPGQFGVAEAQFRLGEWEKALEAYNEVIQQPGHEADEVWSARWDRRGLLPYLKNQVAVRTDFTDESEGTVLSQHLDFTSAWWHNWRVIVSAREDFIQLDEPSLTRESDVSRFEALVTLQRRLRSGYFAEVSLGGTEDNVLYGARFGRFASSGVGWGSIAWSIGYSGNAAATYSLPLRAINGREDRVDFLANGYLHPRVRFDFNAYASRIHVDGDKLGDRYGALGSIEYIFQTETRTRPEVAIGYFGEYARFDSVSKVPQSVTRQLRGEELQVRRALPAEQDVRKALPVNHGREIFDSLVEEETNRHGVQITIAKRIDLDWNIYAQAGVYRDFVSETWEYTLAAGLEYWFNDHAMLYAEVRYDSNGESSDAGVWEASLGAELTF